MSCDDFRFFLTTNQANSTIKNVPNTTKKIMIGRNHSLWRSVEQSEKKGFKTCLVTLKTFHSCDNRFNCGINCTPWISQEVLYRTVLVIMDYVTVSWSVTWPLNGCEEYRPQCFRSNISKTSASVSSGVPNTEKVMKARGRRPSAFIVSRCLDPLMKHEARVFDMASQMKQ